MNNSCTHCGTMLNELGFESAKAAHDSSLLNYERRPLEYHTFSRCHARLLEQLRAERALSDALEYMVGLLQVAEHCQEYEEIEKTRKLLDELYEARKAAGGGPRCKLCGGPRTHAQVFCGAGCSARWESGERPKEKSP